MTTRFTTALALAALVTLGAIAPSASQAGLLLPAVQQVREASHHQTEPTDQEMDILMNGDSQGIALLLPAVQKVREAARR